MAKPLSMDLRERVVAAVWTEGMIIPLDRIGGSGLPVERAGLILSTQMQIGLREISRTGAL